MFKHLWKIAAVALFLLPSTAAASQNIGPVDFFVTASSTTIGSRVSTSTANTTTVGGGFNLPFSSMVDNNVTTATSSANYTYQASAHALLAPVISNGQTYATTTVTHSMALNQVNSFTSIKGNPNASTSITIAGWVTFGVPDVGGAQQVFDDVSVYGGDGHFFVMQNYNGSEGSNYFVWIETGSPTVHSPAILIPVGGTFWFNLKGDYVSGLAQLNLYDTNGNFFGSATTTMATTGTTVASVVIGNNEAGTAVGTTTYEDVMMDTTNAQFPLFGYDATYPAQLLVVGGGGQGGQNGGGGGGGGGVEYRTNFSLEPASTYNVVVGAGATATSGPQLGGTGATSTFGTISAGGGGGGSGRDSGNPGASSGATGGGGGGAVLTSTATHGSGYGGLGYEGYDGGDGSRIPRGFDAGCDASGGGGGGSGGAGVSGNFVGGNGGVGRAFTISGSSVYYGGGGGGAEVCTGHAGDGTGGLGGGANGSSTASVAGTNGLGGGGGGTGGGSLTGGVGGSGTAILAFPTGMLKASGASTATYVKTNVGGNDIYTFTSNGTFVTAPLGQTANMMMAMNY
jgi:hypothetical protein